jgi:hypothetical protein
MIAFEAAIRRLAADKALSIVRDELERRHRASRRRRGAPVVKVRARPHVDAVSGAPTARWTRVGIIAELSSLLRSGFEIDGAFIRRNGPRGLVAAAKKEFGRLEAALNVASLAAEAPQDE